MAIQMKMTIFSNDEVILLLSDHSNNADIVCQRLNEIEIFAKTYFIKTKGLINRRNIWDKIVDYINLSFSRENRYIFYLDKIDNLIFDELLCYNYGIDINGLFSILYNYNKNIMVSLYEEGILSYGVTIEENYKSKMVKLVRHFMGKKDIRDSFGNFYCFYPELYTGFLNPTKVPNITKNGQSAKILKKIFDLSDLKLNYPEKYIFFTSVCDFEGGEAIGEYHLVCKIADLVGKNNLLIKTHPRDTRNIYEKNGFKVDINSSIPWEAILMCSDFSRKVFITATSGSVLAGSLLVEKPIKTYYMFRCCDISNNSLAKASVTALTNLLKNPVMKDVLSNISILEEVSEIVDERTS